MKKYLFVFCVLIFCFSVSSAQTSTFTTTNPSCSGACDGRIAINITGGLPNYTVNISDGTTFTTTPGTYTVTGLCGSASAYNYFVTDALGNTTGDMFYITSPTALFISGATGYSVCEGSCKTISVNTFGGVGPYLYSWAPNTAMTNSVNVCPLTTTLYTVTATDANGCVGQRTINVNVNTTCQNVWPGDANSDGNANNIDILELGLHFSQTGIARTTISNNWQSYFANNWQDTISNGKNLNHSDCNGDGVINTDDTMAVYNNYGASHTFKQNDLSVTDPQLAIVPDQGVVIKGSWGTASVYLGDALTPITNINGVAFTINYDNTLIEPNSIYLEYTSSFLNASNSNLHFRKTDFANGKLYTASTHTVNANVSGFGKIATLHYMIKSTLATDEVLNLSLIQANKSDTFGIITPLTVGTGTLMAVGASVGVGNYDSPEIFIYQNHATSNLNIIGKAPLTKVEIMNLTGQLVKNEFPNSNSCTMDLSNLTSGVYLLTIYDSNKVVSKKKIFITK
ncbi:MAG: hypothetical protein K0S53_514 [Bacteroidetes bacterium]|jgi:hypothetical protein|nr:hypothetical protein [Bacteroidota bacterium]MDF2451879.1 hypothetical protein [Bacteroidota bacterium]